MIRPTAGPPFDPHCPLNCDRGWHNWTDDTGHEWARKCPDCETKAEAMRVPGQRTGDQVRSRTGRGAR
jgi:hypothetical protein